ncbi:ankyrin repeat domain-containing protein 33B-like [Mytilus trossulus]|uniref:ankyrin repeat domain-containing protein 33B-like n=1 Tax=Mytilus trossulus TaxID=6551 RepID=UPI003005B154
MNSDDDDDDLVLQCLYDEFTLLEVVMEGDFESVQSILDDNPTVDELNERDRTGKTALAHACFSGYLPIVEVLSEVPGVDVNLADKEGNTPLIFASQAGYKEILKVLLNDFRKIKVDQKSKAGFTALMKSAIQGRTACAKLILFAGANPRLRDNGRKLTAEEWARFTNRHECADEIAKFTKLKRCLFGGSKKNHKRSNSEPDLIIAAEKCKECKPIQRQKSKSFRKKVKKFIPWSNDSSPSLKDQNPFEIIARCVSTPVLPGGLVPTAAQPRLKRPVSVDHIPRVEITSPIEKG